MSKTIYFTSPLEVDEILKVGESYLRTEEKAKTMKRDNRGFEMEKDYGMMKGMMFDDGFMFNIAPPGFAATYVEAIVEAKRLETTHMELDVRLDTMWKLVIAMNFMASAFLVVMAWKIDHFILLSGKGAAIGPSDTLLVVGLAYFTLYWAYSHVTLKHYEKKMITFIETKMQGILR